MYRGCSYTKALLLYYTLDNITFVLYLLFRSLGFVLALKPYFLYTTEWWQKMQE